MKTMRHLLRCRLWLGAILTFAAVLTLSARAFAFGNVQLKSANIDEADGRWKLEMNINYGGVPHMGHIPFDFVFTLKTYYEYSITDTDKEPQLRPKPMVNQQPQRESVDIDFSDVKGKIWPTTKFYVHLKRDRGFQAGEYSLIIRRVEDNAQLGQPLNIRLNGKNEVVDRRAIVFSSGPRPDAGAKKASTSDADAGEGEKKTESAGDKGDKPAESEAKEPEPAEPKAPPPVEPRPASHGCGCRIATEHSVGFASAAVLLLGTALLALRRLR